MKTILAILAILVLAIATVFTVEGLGSLNSTPYTGIISVCSGLMMFAGTMYAMTFLNPFVELKKAFDLILKEKKEMKKEDSMSTTEYEIQPIKQDIQLAHFRKGYEDALKAACEYKYTYGAGGINEQESRIYHLRTLLREADPCRSKHYVAGWMAQIAEQEEILRQYLKYPTID